MSSPSPATPPDPLSETGWAETGWAETFERRYGPTVFLLFVALVAFLTLQFCAWPQQVVKLITLGPQSLPPGSASRFLDSYLPLAADPFNAQTPSLPQSRFRILAPLLAWFLYLRGPLSGLLTWLVSLPTFYIAALLARRYLSPTNTLLFALAVASVHPFVIGDHWLGYQDVFVALFLLLGMLLHPVWATLPLVFLSMLADERALLGWPGVLCFHYAFTDRNRPGALALRRTAAAAAGALLWFLYASWLSHRLGFTFNDVYSKAAANILVQITSFPYGFFATFRAAWLFPVLGICLLFRHTPRLALVLIATLLATVYASLRVGDVSRTLGFLLPTVLLGLFFLARYRPALLTPVLLSAAILNLLSPVSTQAGENLFRIHSLPMSYFNNSETVRKTLYDYRILIEREKARNTAVPRPTEE